MVATIDCVFDTAIDGVSWVSSWANVTLVWFAALSSATASCAKWSCSSPTCATGPVNGPSIAIEAVHDFELPLLAAAVVELPLLLLVELLLLLPQPPAMIADRARAAKPIRTFTCYFLLLGVMRIVVHDRQRRRPGVGRAPVR